MLHSHGTSFAIGSGLSPHDPAFRANSLAWNADPTRIIASSSIVGHEPSSKNVASPQQRHFSFVEEQQNKLLLDFERAKRAAAEERTKNESASSTSNLASSFEHVTLSVPPPAANAEALSGYDVAVQHVLGESALTSNYSSFTREFSEGVSRAKSYSEYEGCKEALMKNLNDETNRDAVESVASMYISVSKTSVSGELNGLLQRMMQDRLLSAINRYTHTRPSTSRG